MAKRAWILIAGLAVAGACTEDEGDNPFASGDSGLDTLDTGLDTGTDEAESSSESGESTESSTEGSSDSSDSSDTEESSSEAETTGSASGCENADILCEDFEDGVPSGGAWLPKSCSDPNYSLGVVDGALATSGASSSANNSCPLHYELGTLDSFWVTAHVRIQGSAPGMEHEVTFFELGENPDADDPELRIGYRGDNSCNNQGAIYAGLELGATQGPGGEYTGCTGVVPEAETWMCLEVSVVQGNDSLESQMYLDGEALDYLVHSQPKQSVLGNFTVGYLKVGMQSYSGQFDGLLIDDLSVSTQRVGCGG